MQLQQIEIAKIVIPKVRVTAVYDEEQLKLLKDTLAAMGQIQPVVVIERDGYYEVIDGKHRVDEAKERGETAVPAVVYQGDPADGLLMNLILNRVRGKTKASEMVTVIETLWKTHGLDSEAIAKRTGLTRDYIEKLQVISQATPVVRQALDAEIIGVGHAFEVARIPSPIIQEEIMAKQQLWRWSVKELHGQVDKIISEMAQLAGQKAQPPAQAPLIVVTYSCDACKQEMPKDELRPIQICPLCFGRIWQLYNAPIVPPEPDQEKPGGA